MHVRASWFQFDRLILKPNIPGGQRALWFESRGAQDYFRRMNAGGFGPALNRVAESYIWWTVSLNIRVDGSRSR
jgi:hypothetical protein